MVVKALIKNLRESDYLKAFFAKYSGSTNDASSREFTAALIENNVWIFSQMKAGTTFVCNSLAFYNAERSQHSGYDFDDLSKWGVFRNPKFEVSEVANGLRFKERFGGAPWFVQTHVSVRSNPFVLVLITRNVLDYCVSSYFFHFKNRLRKSDVTVDTALPKIVDRFIDTNEKQAQAIEACENVVVTSYEDLMNNKYAELGNIVQRVYGYVDERALKVAISESEPDKVRAFEKARGSAIVAAEGTFSADHFVRSGEIGEGEKFFTPQQKAYIEKKLFRAGISMSGSIIRKATV